MENNYNKENVEEVIQMPNTENVEELIQTEDVESDTPEIKALEDCTMEELFAIAYEEKVLCTDKATKEELIAAINESRSKYSESSDIVVEQSDENIKININDETNFELNEDGLTISNKDGNNVLIDDTNEGASNVDNEVVIGVVDKCSRLNIRKEASKASEVLGILNTNDEVKVNIAESTEDFYKIKCILSNDSLIQGYCVKEFITIK